MLVLRQPFVDYLGNVDVEATGQPASRQRPVTPLPCAYFLETAEHWDPATSEGLDFCQCLHRIEPIEDFGLIPLEVFGSAHAIEPNSGVELAIQPEALASSEPWRAAADADAHMTVWQLGGPGPGLHAGRRQAASEEIALLDHAAAAACFSLVKSSISASYFRSNSARLISSRSSILHSGITA